MTLRAPAQGEHGRRAPGPSHPLQRLGADEVRLARTVLAEHGLVGEHTRFAYLGLEEPPKSEVLAFRPGEPVERAWHVVNIVLWHTFGMTHFPPRPHPRPAQVTRTAPAPERAG
jgi:Cu2+-containing amine oxidase